MNITQRFVLFTLVFLNACDAVSPFVTQKAFDERLDRDRDGVKNDDDCEPDNQAVTTFSFWHDLDGDGRGAGEALKACIAPKGYVDNHDDCDDTNSNIYPFRDERCNDIDDNCDGVTDTDAVDRSTFYLDNDKDTFGDPAVSVTTCDKPSGYVTDHTDCNDNIASVAPDAIEVCNDVDDDCDGATDTDAVNPPKWYADGDGDGFGDAEISSGAGADRSIASCMQPFGYIPDHTDCNDANKYIHPGQFEICNGMDDDCDDTTDEDAVDAPTFYADTDEDKYGNPNVSVTVCVKPNGYVEDKTDCDDTDKSVHPNNVEICNSIDDNCDDEIDTDAIDQQTFFVDADSDGYGDASITTTACKKPDGYVTNNTDCDDTDKTVFPGQTEVCNGVDDNCNGSTDTDVAALPKWYVDADEDGFGNIKFLIADCDKPEGYVANKNDCNDLNPDVHPDAAEVCNSIDDDCDGSTDANALDAIWYFADEDEDGYGNAAISLHVCEEPEGFVTDDTDCNDLLDFVHPDTVEVCEDGLDNDCNGVTDTDAVEVVWYRDADEDGFGTSNETQMACSPPPGFVGNAFDCNDDSDAIKPGIAEVCNNGVDDNCDGGVNQCVLTGIQQTDSAQTMIHGNAPNLFTDTVTSVGDFNGDEYDDFMIGVRYDSSAGKNAGAAYLFLGPTNTGVLNLNNAKAKWTGENPEDFAGETISGIGDVNGDGKADVFVGASGYGIPSSNNGAVYLILGSKNPIGGSLSGATAKWTGEADGDAAGRSIFSSGDVNGDGKADILISAWLNDTTGLNAGAVYLILGSKNPIGGSLSEASAKWTGEANESFTGKSVSGDDIDGDGKADILIGSHGAIYLILGSKNPISGSLSGASAKWTGEGVGDITGNIVLTTGNINSDQFADILVGLPNVGSGRIYLILGSANPINGSLSQATAKWTGEGDMDLAGYSLSTGDLNNDGYDDILIGAPENDTGGNNAGKVYLIYGSTSLTSSSLAGASATWTGVTAIDQFGTKVSVNGDINNDSYSDILIAAPYHDVEMKDQGIIYLYLGLGL